MNLSTSLLFVNIRPSLYYIILMGPRISQQEAVDIIRDSFTTFEVLATCFAIPIHNIYMVMKKHIISNGEQANTVIQLAL